MKGHTIQVAEMHKPEMPPCQTGLKERAQLSERKGKGYTRNGGTIAFGCWTLSEAAPRDPRTGSEAQAIVGNKV